jgi:hypothetical protein
MTINVIEVFIYLFILFYFQIVKLQFILHSTSTEYENNLLFFYFD